MDFEIRKDLRPQGPRRSDTEREEHLRLVDLGMGNTEACRIIGINRRTGKRRLYGRQASARYRAAPPVVDRGLPWQAPEPPARPEEPVGPSRYLTEADRIHIADRLRETASVRAIAAELGRSPSTVSREIRRNRTLMPGPPRPPTGLSPATGKAT
ncbi:hypothetical protein GCM10014715_26440 [Streptomyces spiralis]|uniref:Transposase IS30-like HTH domain-containing protein n=1 Tax=Streptomyces spiralis TaxID=66376 RepID=A0A919DS00_9ACTN|nr:hypothetical protein GCM10014715_26440 [Streptomyces spiralis]